MCLFTCCVVRAVHLDLVPDMTATTFLRSLKRFVSRKGIPSKILSDNGKTFKHAAKLVRSLLKQSEVQQYMSSKGIKWAFNVEKAPWWGVLERQVKSTKRCLRKVVGRAKLFYDELNTVIFEIKAVINLRPDLHHLPSHFLYGRRILTLPDGLTEEDLDEEFIPSQPTLTRRLKHLNVVVNQFWKQ